MGLWWPKAQGATVAAIGHLDSGKSAEARRAGDDLLVSGADPADMPSVAGADLFDEGTALGLPGELGTGGASTGGVGTERRLREVEQCYLDTELPQAMALVEQARQGVQRAVENPVLWGHELASWEETYRVGKAKLDFLLEGQRWLASASASEVGHAQALRLFNGGLSADWAQQVSGLVDAELHLASRVGLQPVRLGVIDTSDHGAKAARLAVGGWPVPSPVPQTLELFLHPSGGWTVSHATEVARELRQRPAEDRPQLFNLSFSMGRGLKEELEPLIADGALVVTSAGNSGNRPISAEKAALDLVVVSSSSPFGPFRSLFAQVGPEVTVFAPSESHVHSVFLGQPAPFGGTSGAAPLAARAVGLALSTLGELTPAEARALLRRTAIGEVDWPGRAEGIRQPGVLNAYRLVRVAERLVDMGWPARRDELLSHDDLYDFSAEGAALVARGTQLLEAGEVDLALPLLRQAFLLTESAAARKALAALFEAQGNWVDSLYYRAFDLSAQDVALELLRHGGDLSVREFLEAAVEADVGDLAAIERWLTLAQHLPERCIALLVSRLWELGEEGEQAVARYHATCPPVRMAIVNLHTGLHRWLAERERQAA